MSLSRITLLTLIATFMLTAPAGASYFPRETADLDQQPSDTHSQAPDKKNPPTGGNNGLVSASRLVVISPPTGIFTTGQDQNRSTNLLVRGTAPSLYGPTLIGGELEDKDSHNKLPIEAFQLLVGEDSNGIVTYKPVTATTALPDGILTKVQIALRQDSGWVLAGSYTGTLQIAAVGDTVGQGIKLDVSVRPRWAWWVGIVLLAVGAGLSWFAVVYAARRRQMAGNEILVARLAEALRNLRDGLNTISAAGAPVPNQTLGHIDHILQEKLQQLLTDKELSIIAGVTVPPAGTVSVLDEVEGVNRVVQNGFDALLGMWNRAGLNQPALVTFFNQMDQLGSVARPLTDIDQQIKTILGAAGPAASGQKGTVTVSELAMLPSETLVAHRIVFTAYLLDILSFLTVVVLGVYILIWKNPGFGSAGNLIEAFFWGLGLKLGTDTARLGASDVRTDFGVKIPAS
jgi:hypothetical protein